jgi:hypothetical protein
VLLKVDHAESVALTINNVAPQSFSPYKGSPIVAQHFSSVTFQIGIDCFQLVGRSPCIQYAFGYEGRVGQQPHGTLLDVRKE